MNNMEKAILEVFCSRFKDKIGEGISYDEYISSFTKEQLESLLRINAVMEDNSEKFAHVLSVSIHKKNDVIEELKQNIREVYTNIVKNINEEVIQQLELYIKEYANNILEIDLSKMRYSLHFIELLSSNCMAKVKYLKKENKLYLYTPVEIRNILKTIIKDRGVRKSCKENSMYKKNLHNLIATYGIIPLEKLNEIYNKIYGKVDQDSLIHRILINSIFDEDIRLVHAEDGYIAYGIGFENGDNALEFFYSLEDDMEYKIYKKEEYQEIGDGTYHCNFKEFDDLYDFLEMNFNMSEDEIYDFDDMFILDYVFSYQLDANVAKKNLSNNLEHQFMMLNISDKAYISRLILAIARNYPNFNYKGYTYNEVKNSTNKIR